MDALFPELVKFHLARCRELWILLWFLLRAPQLRRRHGNVLLLLMLRLLLRSLLLRNDRNSLLLVRLWQRHSFAASNVTMDCDVCCHALCVTAVFTGLLCLLLVASFGIFLFNFLQPLNEVCPNRCFLRVGLIGCLLEEWTKVHRLLLLLKL